MMLRFSYISIAVLYFNVCMIAQPVVSSSYETMLETAATCAENHDYINAIEWFEKAYKESKDPNLQVAIGDMYMLLRDYAKAEKTYDRVLKRDKRDEFFDIRLDYARAMKAQGKYKLALDEFNGFISTTESDSLRNEAKLELRGILLMEKYAENIEAAVSFAGESINSPSAESSPALYSDGTLYFSSMNAKTPTIIDGEEGEYHAKIYSAARTPQGDFSKASALDEAINRIDFYNTGVSFSEDGQKMYFTRAKYNNNGVENSQIYLSKRAGDKWGSPYPIEALNNEFKSRHPYEGELFGRKVLYYISDMPGGYGGYDIYYSTIAGDAYEKPVNLGEKINTPRNEMSPFYKDGALYFSSNGHPGMGGLDNFYTEWDGSKWSEVTNMGFNYNTSYDDSFLRFNQGGTAGYVVSNRTHKDKKKYKNTDTCCDDIYLIQIRDLVIELKTIVNNEKGPLEGATVELFEGSKKVPVDSKTNFLSNDFGFLLDSDKSYKAYITREGYYTDSISFNTNGIFDDYTVSKTVTLKAKPEAPKRIVSRNEPILLKSIFFDLADDKIRPDAEPDLEYLKTLMDKYPDMVIELSSHTDSRGDNEYNKKLSQRRANSTKAWLVEEGVEAARIKAVGYGETKLLNKCKDKVKCSEEEHQLNRRSEFKIIAGPQTIEIKMEG
ncbi:MAG: OmpA family protein [Saprospiraceae bacterium]|nr:OmpA family protein [Saprospiraceae bacterium]